jgi:hypothetical protein
MMIRQCPPSQSGSHSSSHSIKEKSMEKLHQARDYMGEQASHIGHRVQSGAHQARDWFDQTLEEYPLAVGAAFFTLGIIGGLVIPATRPEHRYLGKYRDKLVNQAEELGSELIDKGQKVAERAVSKLQETVSNKSNESQRSGKV